MLFFSRKVILTLVYYPYFYIPCPKSTRISPPRLHVSFFDIDSIFSGDVYVKRVGNYHYNIRSKDYEDPRASIATIP